MVVVVCGESGGCSVSDCGNGSGDCNGGSYVTRVLVMCVSGSDNESGEPGVFCLRCCQCRFFACTGGCLGVC